jgi:DNA-binding IclR family transcriptional regulator
MRLPESLFVTRTMQALEVLAFAPLSAPEMAQTLAIHPRTARRLLNRLWEEGYLTRTDDARRLYAPSMRIVALAGQIVERAPLTRIAAPFVERLHERTGAAAHLTVASYLNALCLVHSANGDCSARPQLRELVPAHCTASGKALLAFRAPWRDSVLSAPLTRYTAKTVTDPQRLREEVEQVRARGYAHEDGEYQEGVRGFAAPVLAPSGEAVAALGVAVRGEPEGDLAPAVVALAAEASAALEADRG